MSNKDKRKTKKSKDKETYPDLIKPADNADSNTKTSQRKQSAWDQDDLNNDNAILGGHQQDDSVRQPLAFNSDNSK